MSHDVTAVLTPGEPAELAPARMVGPWRILRPLGQGGMGAVFLAEQTQPVRRQVALKLLAMDLCDSDFVARFHQERQLLARLSHPNIAQILDAGTSGDGRPFYVMEYVPGEPLNRHVVANGPTLRARLELFLQACAAVQYAHQQGVIHRDLKPGNLLVGDYDGQPRLKVIDFGIAKNLVQDPDSTRNAATVAGQPMGTLAYMSPEQADGDPLKIDTRTDVYALGVVLYEMLTGRLPVPHSALQHTGERLGEVLRAQSIAPPSKLAGEHARKVRGELDWIVLKALEFDRERRYATVAELAGDIKSWLTGKPVSAGPPGSWYRLRRYLQRHRVAIGVAALLLLTLLGGVAATGYMAIEARQQAEHAQAERDKAQRALNRARAVERHLTQLLAATDPFSDEARGEAPPETVGELLQRAAVGLDNAGELPLDVRARLALVLGRTHLRRAEPERALDLLKTAESLARSANLMPLADDARTHLASVLLDLGAYRDALDAARPTLSRLRERRERGDALRLNAARQLAAAEAALGRDREAIAILDAELAGVPGNSSDIDKTRADLAALLAGSGEHQRAQVLIDQALAAQRVRAGDEALGTVLLAAQRGEILIAAGAYAEAETALREVLPGAERWLGIDHPNVLRIRHAGVRAIAGQGRHAEAIDGYRSLLELLAGASTAARVRLYGLRFFQPTGPAIEEASVRSNLAVALRLSGDLNGAQVEVEKVLALRSATLGADHPDTLHALQFLAVLAQQRGALDVALPMLRELAERQRTRLGADHTEALLSENNYLAVLRDSGDVAGALEGFAALYARAKARMPPEHWHLAAIAGNYGQALAMAQRYGEAEPLIAASLSSLRKAFDDANDPRIKSAEKRRSDLYRAWGKLPPDGE